MSNTTVFIDTETTGKWDFEAAVEAPLQPHMIQLAAIRDVGGVTVETYNSLVHVPDDVRMEEGALAVHGITPAQAKEKGAPLNVALMRLDRLLDVHGLIVCHNTDFDLKVLLAAYVREGLICIIPSVNTFCTMRQSTNVCKLPGKYGYKWPTLDEAYRMLVDPSGFEGAHDAFADVTACRAIYYALLERQQPV